MKQNRFSLWPYIKPYKVKFFIACICIVVENALEISLPFLMDILLTKGMSHHEDGTYTYDAGFVFMMGGIMIGFAVAAFLLGLASARFTAKAGRGMGFELRKQEYQKIQNFSFKNLDHFRLNSLMTRMTNDVQIISDTFCSVLRPLLRAPFQLVFAITFAFIISTQLSIVFAIAVPTLAILLAVIIILTRPQFYKLQASLDRINRTTNESLTAMKLIRANAKKDYEIEKFNTVNSEVKSIGQKALALLATNMGIMNMMTYVCIVGILLIGGRYALRYDDANMANHIAAFLSYTNQTLASLIMLSNVFMMFTRSSASLARVKEVFECENEIKDNKDSLLEVENGCVEFKNVSFKYNENATEYVLKDISFKIPNGHFVGILGETGSSKSTLIYLMERFYDINEGQILISDHDIKEYSLHELRNQISISFQGPRLFTGTVRENLLWGNPQATQEEIEQACKIACCYDFIINSLDNGFDTMISQGGNNVSGGQRQRLCIARALLKKPKILILDDSFSALDRITEGQLKKNLKEYLPDMTKIVISQKVSTISDADSIIVLDNGHISNIGTSEYLKDHDPIYQDIYKIQTEGLAQ